MSLKSYCPACAKPNLYNLNKPIICGFCGEKLSNLAPPTKQARAKYVNSDEEDEEERRRLQKLKNKERKNKLQRFHDEDDYDDDDDDDGYEAGGGEERVPDLNGLQWEGLKPPKQKGFKVGDIIGSIDPKEINPKSKRPGLGKISKKKLEAQFRKEGGTLRPDK